MRVLPPAVGSPRRLWCSRMSRDRRFGLVRGIGVYAEQDQRVVRVPLSRQPARGENLTVTLTDEEGGPGKTLLTGSFVAP